MLLDPRVKKDVNDTKVVTVIGAGTTIIGEVRSKGTIRVEGAVSGRVQCDDTIVVQDTGRIKGDLVAGQIVLSGEVEGNVYAHDRLEVTSKAKLIGDITAPRVAIAEGVVFEGKCSMKSPGQIKGGPGEGEPSRQPQPQPQPQKPAPGA